MYGRWQPQLQETKDRVESVRERGIEARVRYESVRGKENIEPEDVVTRQNVSEKAALKRTRNSHRVWLLTVMVLLDMLSTSTLPDAVLIVLVFIIILYRLHKDILSKSALPSGSLSEV